MDSSVPFVDDVVVLVVVVVLLCSFVSPFDALDECLTVVMIDLMIAEFDDFSVVSLET